jgi:hypothetical protein
VVFLYPDPTPAPSESIKTLKWASSEEVRVGCWDDGGGEIEEPREMGAWLAVAVVAVVAVLVEMERLRAPFRWSFSIKSL